MIQIIENKTFTCDEFILELAKLSNGKIIDNLIVRNCTIKDIYLKMIFYESKSVSTFFGFRIGENFRAMYCSFIYKNNSELISSSLGGVKAVQDADLKEEIIDIVRSEVPLGERRKDNGEVEPLVSKERLIERIENETL